MEETIQKRGILVLTGELGEVLIKGEIRLKDCAYYPSWETKFQEVERATESLTRLPIST